jgi:hypothetical protein
VKWLACILGVAALAVAAADVVTLAWEPSPSGGLRNYLLAYGTNAGSLAYSTNCGLALTQTVCLPFRGWWFFGVRAVDTNGVLSPISNLVEWEATPVAPVMGGVPWVVVGAELEHSTNLGGSWHFEDGMRVWVPATNASGFFRARGLTIERVTRPVGP